MKPHYFQQDKPDSDDFMLEMAKGQGYVPAGCLLGGQTAMSEVHKGRNPCWECNGPREKCGGKPKQSIA
jgi:hypothetical protein